MDTDTDKQKVTFHLAIVAVVGSMILMALGSLYPLSRLWGFAIAANFPIYATVGLLAAVPVLTLLLWRLLVIVPDDGAAIPRKSLLLGDCR